MFDVRPSIKRDFTAALAHINSAWAELQDQIANAEGERETSELRLLSHRVTKALKKIADIEASLADNT